MVKHWPGDHMVPMFTNCQIKEDTQLDHHVNLQIYLKTRSLGTSGPRIPAGGITRLIGNRVYSSGENLFKSICQAITIN